MKINKSQRFVSFLVAFLMIFGSFPVNALEMTQEYSESDEALRLAIAGDYGDAESTTGQAIAGDAKWVENYPNGLLNFIGGQFNVSETNKYIEIPIARQGGTSGEVSVDLKTIDILAEYGKDYVIKVYENGYRRFGGTEVEKNPDSVPLIESMSGGSEVDIGINSDDSSYVNLAPAKVVTSQAISTEENNKQVYEILKPVSEVTTSQGISLREAKEKMTGVESDRPAWKEIDKNSVENLKANYDETFGSIPGAKATLTYKDGEYLKYIYIIPLDDKISEEDEQIMLMLENPTNGSARGENYMASAVIEDNEPVEKSTFEFESDSALIDSNKAKATIVRKGGINRYASVVVGTVEDTAVNGADYEAGLTELQFVPGMERQTVTVNILNNEYRTEDREFMFMLDSDDENVNEDKAHSDVIIPAAVDAMTPDEFNMKMSPKFLAPNKENFLLLNSAAASKGAEKISEYGYYDRKGQWVIAPSDFIHSTLNNGGIIEGDHVKIKYTGGARSSHVKDVKLYGVNNMEFGFTNYGVGYTYQDYNWKYKFPWWYKNWYDVNVKDYKFTFEIEAPGCTRAINSFRGYSNWNTMRTVLSEKQWNTTWIGIYTQADNNNTIDLNFHGFRLFLKDYTARALDAQKEKKVTYEIKSGQLSSTSEQDYTPGQLIIESIGSNVGNVQGYDTSRKEAKVYRSDKVRLTMKYDASNYNGEYAAYKGFRIKNGSNWITYYNSATTQDLNLDTEFFKKSGMLDAIRGGNIEIQPIFEKRTAKVDINVNTQLGSCSNFGVGVESKSLNNLFIGDKIVDIAAKPLAVAMTPNFSAKTGAYPQSARKNNAGIKLTDTLAYSTINYTVPDSYSIINLNFENPTLITAANPSVYDNRVTDPIYWVDGVKYVDHQQLSDKMEQVFSSNQNPTIKMEFEYTFDGTYINDKKESELRKDMFGTPESAVLTVYKSDGTIRETKSITPQNGKFAVEGKLNDLGWAIDDYASVSIIGSKSVNNQKVQTRETVVDFLYNTANAVVVTSPDGSKIGSKVGQPAEIKGANPTEEYGLSAYTSGNFITKWADYSVDTNGDGFESVEEQNTSLKKLKALGYNGTLDNARRTNIYYGNEFFMRPQFLDPTKIMYNFEKRPVEASNAKIGFKLVQTGGTVLHPDIKQEPRVIKNSAVILAGKEIKPFNDEGMYLDIDPLYVERGYYLGKIFIDPYEYCFEVQQGINNTIEINTSEIMPPTDFTVEVDGSITDFSKTQDYLDIENTTTVFSYGFSNLKTGITPNSSKIRIYNKEDEVVQTFETGPSDADGKFKYSVNLLNAGIKPGYKMSICGVFTDGDKIQEFPEVPVGLTFSRQLSAINVAASFKTPIQPVVKLIGKVNTAYDLGMDISLEDKMTALDKYTDSEGRERLPLVISFGFSKEFEKEFGDEAEEKASEETEDEIEDETYAEKIIDPELSDEEALDEIKNTQDEASANSMTTEGSAGLKFNISLSVILEKMDGETYFNSVVILATAEAEGGYSVSYVTPIGIPVTASISVEGTALATLGMEANIDKQFDDQYRFDGEGKVSFNPKNYSSYFKFVVTPSIELSAGAGFNFLNLSISGRGDFDFNFNVPIYGENVASGGSGGLEMSAALSVKILFIQKKWTLYKSDYISLFNYKNAMMLSNPYQDYMYASLDDITEDDIIPRDYLKDKSGWLGEPVLRNRMLSLAAEKSNDEKTLITNAYPYPQTKLIKLDGTRTMMMFIDDDENRDDCNRAILKYSIGENNVWSTPIAVDNDGTWDEAPEAFTINGKIFIIWSDASRLFTKLDSEISMLKAMDINAKWYDPDTGSLSNETVEITKTISGKEECADLTPMISFDKETGRLLIYYTKIDYDDIARESADVDLSETETIPQEDEKLYGDIVNGYNVIAYRYADLDEDGQFIWSESYNPNEGFSPELAEQYYGQRFLDLAVPATIMDEVETSTVTESIPKEDDIYNMGTLTKTVETVKQRAVYDKDNPTDPRVVDSDLITYNGLALYAYTMDFDANLKTVNDQKIYLQIYNFEEKTFTHPILLTNDDVQNTTPRFVRSKGLTYLYWLCDGEIAYIDISTLVQSGLKKVTVEGSGKEIYVIDKGAVGPSGGKNIAIAKETDNPIGEFQIASNDEGIYLLWPQFKTVLKDGIDKSSIEACYPENIIREKPIFAAYSSPKQQRTNAEVPDASSSGPSELISGDGYDWSTPVQITFEEGANYSDISFVVTEEDNLKLSYIKYEQYLGDDGIAESNETNRTLAINNISVNSDIEFSDMILPEKGSGNFANAQIILKNTGVKPIVDTKYQTYIKIDDEEFIEEDWHLVQDLNRNGYILGGDTIPILPCYTLPNSKNIIAGIRFKDKNDITIKEIEIPAEMHSHVDITVLDTQFLSKDKANVILTAKNTGNISFEGNLEIKNNETTLYNEYISLQTDEIKNFNLLVDISTGKFTETKENEKGGIYDALPLTVIIGDNKADATITRSADKEIVEAMDNIKTFNLYFSDSLLYDNSVITTSRNKLEKLDVNYELKDEYDETMGEANPYEVVLSSDNNNISLLQDGTFTMDRKGSVTVTATLKPLNNLVEAKQNSYNVADTSYLYPAGVVKTKSVTISVPDSSSSRSGTTMGENYTLTATDGIVKITADEIKNKDGITIKGDAVVTFDKNVIGKIIGLGTNVEFKVKRMENSNTFAISITVDGKEITDLGNGRIVGGLPYSLNSGESSDNVVLYQTINGKSECLTFAGYENGNITFASRTLGVFEARYNKVNFADVSDSDWFYKAVNFASAREVVKGVGNNSFEPNASVKRADFLIMAMRTFEIKLSDNSSENFADSGNTYYTDYLAVARDMGIVNGTGDNKFNPENEISREDMFAILYNIMKKLNIDEEMLQQETTFEDSSNIAEYAKAAVDYLMTSQIISGYNGNINPKGKALRSETAQIMYKIMLNFKNNF